MRVRRVGATSHGGPQFPDDSHHPRPSASHPSPKVFHLPKLPGGELAWTPVVLLTAVAVALAGVGLAGLRRLGMST
jgi:hypothetical protein